MDVCVFHVSGFSIEYPWPTGTHIAPRRANRCFELVFAGYAAFSMSFRGVFDREANARSYFGLMSVLAVLVR